MKGTFKYYGSPLIKWGIRSWNKKVHEVKHFLFRLDFKPSFNFNWYPGVSNWEYHFSNCDCLSARKWTRCYGIHCKDVRLRFLSMLWQRVGTFESCSITIFLCSQRILSTNLMNNLSQSLMKHFNSVTFSIVVIHWGF